MLMNSQDQIIKLSISVVIYRPNIEVLKKEFLCLKKAILKVQSVLPIRFDFFIVDNYELNDYELIIHNFFNDYFLELTNIDCHYIKSPKNLGYGFANNLAINNVESNYHLVMNPDVYVEEDCFLNAVQYLEKHQEVGLLTPSIFGEDGRRHFLCKLNPTLFDMFLRFFPWLAYFKTIKQRMLRFEMQDHDYNQEIRDIQYPSGCFMFFRTSILKKIGGFDEDFFMYVEDADIGRRVLDVSHSAYVPEVKIVHKWSRQTHSHIKFKWITIKSVFTYWRKYGGVF